jgi:hypothetical protein
MRLDIYMGALALNGLLATASRAVEPPIRFVTADYERTLQATLPTTDSAWFEALKDQGLVFYTDREMPRAYQFWDGLLQGIHNPLYNISAAKPYERHGNPNQEFPWRFPSGTDEVPRGPGTGTVTSVKFVVFPRDKDGKPMPIRWWRQRLPHDQTPSFVWNYPPATVFGEILCLRNPEGYDRTFEVRTRQKNKDGQWRVNLFRPFPTAESLLKRLDQLEDEDALQADAKQVKQLRDYLSRPRDVYVYHKRNGQTPLLFYRQAHFEFLPPLAAPVVDLLLTSTPFTSARGQAWSTAGTKKTRQVAYAPSTKADYHIVPRNYHGAFLELSSKRCTTCHSTVNAHANQFENLLVTGKHRDWYGRVRGSDQIFSFHIFEPSSIAWGGTPVPVRLNQRLLVAGLLRPGRE